MSLDVSLTVAEAVPIERDGRIVPIREGGRTRIITLDEWRERHPDRDPIIPSRAFEELESHVVYHGNITHNLNIMADAAGIYQAVWEPDENEITHARQLIQPLVLGLERLRANPTKFKRFDPENGWGSYEVLIEFLEEYLAACRKYPDASVSVWR